MTALRQQMIRQMDLKNLSPHTRRAYLSAVTNLAKHYRQSPETISSEMIEDYLLYLKNEKGRAPVCFAKKCKYEARIASVFEGLSFFLR